MSHRLVGGCLSVFALFTAALMINLTNFQSGTRELAPAPSVMMLALSAGPAQGTSDDGGLVILNSSTPQPSATTLEVQRELNGFGYRPGSIDGSASLMTLAAVMAYEYDNGLPLTAALDDVQLQRLLLGTGRISQTSMENAGLPASDQARQVMQTVQRSLKRLGYDPGAVDGTYSAETERAIRNLETDSNLPETGRVSGRLVEKLTVLDSRGKLKMTRR